MHAMEHHISASHAAAAADHQAYCRTPAAITVVMEKCLTATCRCLYGTGLLFTAVVTPCAVPTILYVGAFLCYKGNLLPVYLLACSCYAQCSCTAPLKMAR